MKCVSTIHHDKEFQVLLQSQSAQCALMILGSGDVSDDSVSNEHPDSEQWTFVISGTGRAIGKKRSLRRNVKLSPHSLTLIEKGELHQIKNTGSKPLVTLNFYAPPAYNSEGEPKK